VTDPNFGQRQDPWTLEHERPFTFSSSVFFSFDFQENIDICTTTVKTTGFDNE